MVKCPLRGSLIYMCHCVARVSLLCVAWEGMWNALGFGCGGVMITQSGGSLILHEGLRFDAFAFARQALTVVRPPEGKPLRKEEQEHIFKRSGLAPDGRTPRYSKSGITGR